MTRLARLSARAYGRMTPEQKQAVDMLEWNRPSAARRGEAKTILGWRRTRDETIAYALGLLDQGMIERAVAARLDVGDRYLRRLLDGVDNPRNRPFDRSTHAGSSGTNRQGQGDWSS